MIKYRARITGDRFHSIPKKKQMRTLTVHLSFYGCGMCVCAYVFSLVFFFYFVFWITFHNTYIYIFIHFFHSFAHAFIFCVENALFVMFMFTFLVNLLRKYLIVGIVQNRIYSKYVSELPCIRSILFVQIKTP